MKELIEMSKSKSKFTNGKVPTASNQVSLDRDKNRPQPRHSKMPAAAPGSSTTNSGRKS